VTRAQAFHAARRNYHRTFRYRPGNRHDREPK
jgi:hypothetical protein